MQRRILIEYICTNTIIICHNLVRISHWRVTSSNLYEQELTNTRYMFYSSRFSHGESLQKWDLSSVTIEKNMFKMLSEASSFVWNSINACAKNIMHKKWYELVRSERLTESHSTLHGRLLCGSLRVIHH